MPDNQHLHNDITFQQCFDVCESTRAKLELICNTKSLFTSALSDLKHWPSHFSNVTAVLTTSVISVATWMFNEAANEWIRTRVLLITQPVI